MFKNEELRTVKCAYNEMKAMYVTNMNRNMTSCLDTKDVAELFQFHEAEKKIALANFKEMTRECSDENKEECLSQLENVSVFFIAVAITINPLKLNE
jgi:hypothetical protein